MKQKDNAIRERILLSSSEILRTEGAGQFNMRTIAKKSEIALGTIYNYFDTKDAILIALAEDFWRTALQHMGALQLSELVFPDQLAKIYDCLLTDFSDFKTNWIGLLRSVNKEELKSGMQKEEMLLREVSGFILSLLKAAEVAPTVWDNKFTPMALADFICNHIFHSLSEHQENINFLVEIVRRLLF